MKSNEENPFDADCCQPFLFPGGPKGVLLLHGFTGSVSHMRPLVRRQLFTQRQSRVGVYANEDVHELNRGAAGPLAEVVKARQ